jgi:hypothetical protein
VAGHLADRTEEVALGRNKTGERVRERSPRKPMWPQCRPFTNLHAVDPAPVRSRSPTVFAPPADLRAHFDAA